MVNFTYNAKSHAPKIAPKPNIILLAVSKAVVSS